MYCMGGTNFGSTSWMNEIISHFAIWQSIKEDVSEMTEWPPESMELQKYHHFKSGVTSWTIRRRKANQQLKPSGIVP